MPAHAGFKWVPADPAPRQVYNPQAQPRVVKPAPMNNDSDVMNMVVETYNAPDDQIESDYYERPQTATPAPVVRQPAPAPSQNYNVVEGFGNDIPLAMALRQVVPANYAFSFDDTVNPGAKVSWNGGKPWNLVVNDMVAPLGVNARISGNAVSLSKNNPAPAPVMKTAQQPAPSYEDPLLPMPEDNISVSMNDDMDFAEPSINETLADAPEPKPLFNDPGMPGAMPQQRGDAMTDTFNNRPQRRMRMIDQIDQQIQQQDIEMRMNNTMPQNNFMGQVQPIQSNRPYSIEPYVPPNYTMPERDATVSNDAYMGNKTDYLNNKTWEASRGDSLKETLMNWSRMEGINMVWNAPRDYTLTSNIFINDSFKNAVRTVYEDGLPAGQKPSMKFVDNPASPNSTTFVVGG